MTDAMREEFEKNYQRALTQVRYDQETDTFVPKRRGNYANEEFARILHGAWQAWKLAWQAARTVPEGFVMVPVEMLDRFPELNEFNYSHDDVCELNAWGIDLVLSAAPEGKK